MSGPLGSSEDDFPHPVHVAGSVETDSLQALIEEAFEQRSSPAMLARPDVREAVMRVMRLLDQGILRVSEKRGATWHVNSWLKKALLLSFPLFQMEVIPGGPGNSFWWDKVPLKFEGWDASAFQEAGFRAVPSCIVRRSAYIAPDAVLMPCFVNVGAFIGPGTMIDTWATVGSCAQIGAHVHISGGAGIGGVLEPLQANPVIIEDGCFVGARAEVAEGVIIREGAVLAMGVYLGASTKIVDRETGEITQGEVPPYSVVVPGTLPGSALPGKTWGPSLYCAVIVKKVDAQTRKKTSLNALLRSVSENPL